MKDILYRIIYWVAGVHDRILSINDPGGYYLNDKQLHFLVMGALGLLGIFIIYPIFKALAEHGHTMVIAWLYVFTCLLVVSFAIEIGQWYSGTGRIEMLDVIYGIGGFLVMFAIFAVIRSIFNAIVGAVKHDSRKH